MAGRSPTIAVLALAVVTIFLFPGPGAVPEATVAPSSLELFVAVNGSDLDDGTPDHPFASVERARDAIRAMKRAGPLPQGGVTVQIKSGTYPLSRTFALGEEDSGTADASIVYRRFGKGEVRLVGGRQISGFRRVATREVLERLPSAVRDRVLQVDLKSQGVSDYGKLTSRGYHRPVQVAPLELFFMDRPMQLARWPNHGWAHIVNRAPSPPGRRGWNFVYEGNRPSRWRASDDVWLHGYWSEHWADAYVKVKSVDAADSAFRVSEYPDPAKFLPPRDYYALNVLEELDEPGEWYLDRRTGILYFLAPAPLEQGEVMISQLTTVISLNNASHVTLRDLTFEICRGNAVEITGGAHNRVAGCVIRNSGNDAVRILGGNDNAVIGCDIFDTGGGGVHLQGGDRKTLRPAGHFAENNHIHHFSRWCRTYHPAIGLFGVGNIASHNLIHDAPHTAIMFSGNDHLVQFNEIRQVALETDDVGAVYTFFEDWTNRGNVVRYNFFRDIVGTSKGVGVVAVYLDGGASGTTVRGNLFVNVQKAVLIGGGRDNSIENNMFVDCTTGVSIDARGYAFARKDFAEGGRMRLYEKLREVGFDRPPYSTRYPALLNILNDDPALPKGNRLLHNISSGGTWLTYDFHSQRLLEVEGNVAVEKSRFLNPAQLNFDLPQDSLAYATGFERVPIERIGLYLDEFRPALPAGNREDNGLLRPSAKRDFKGHFEQGSK